jgi:hypothetical protein
MERDSPTSVVAAIFPDAVDETPAQHLLSCLKREDLHEVHVLVKLRTLAISEVSHLAHVTRQRLVQVKLSTPCALAKNNLKKLRS